jgi:lysophospholipid acyltransferase 1/2
MGTSFKLILDNWNITTLVWLRRVVYDRAPFQKTFAVFLVSAFWHGFYPGYYFMFLSAALFTVVARQVRFVTCSGKRRLNLGSRLLVWADSAQSYL